MESDVEKEILFQTTAFLGIKRFQGKNIRDVRNSKN